MKVSLDHVSEARRRELSRDAVSYESELRAIGEWSAPEIKTSRRRRAETGTGNGTLEILMLKELIRELLISKSVALHADACEIRGIAREPIHRLGR